MAVDSKLSAWRDWTIFGLRWAFLVAFSLVFAFTRFQNQPIEALVSQLAIPLAVGIVTTLLYGACISISALNPAAPYVLMLGDWAIAGLFVHVSKGDPYLVIGITAALIIPGMLRLGVLWGVLQAFGVLAAALGAITIVVGVDRISAAVPTYIVPVVVAVWITVVTAAWVYMHEEQAGGEQKQAEKVYKARLAEIEEMGNRARAVSQLATTLSSTLSYEKVLDTALDIGQGLRKQPNQRMLSLVLLYEPSGKGLYIANSRGLKPVDEPRIIRGQSGIVARVLSEGVPVVGKDPTRDPELGTFQSFAGLRSMLCIPLTAAYDSFGVLLYGSDVSSAFNDEHMDTLQAIGTQVAIALNNARLYGNLMGERDRIIELEEDARKALARDLHDSPAQTIAVVKTRLEIIRKYLERDPARVPQELQEVEALAMRANEEVRHVLSSLYPLALESLGLLGALNQKAKEMQDKYNQRVVMKLPPDLEVCFSKHQQGVIYSIVTESVENATKHAQAAVINVTAARQDDNMVIQIADNGKGFEVEAARKNERGRYGLDNLAKRAESLDGLMNIESQIGRGTRITLMLPVRDSSRAGHAPADTAPSRPVRVSPASPSSSRPPRR